MKRVTVTLQVEVDDHNATRARVGHAIALELALSSYDIVEVVMEDGEDLTGDGL